MSNCLKNANIENEGVQELCHLGTPSAWHILLDALVPQEITKDVRTAVPHPLITSLNYIWSKKKPEVTLERNTRSEEKWVKRILGLLVLGVLSNGNLSLYTNYICEQNQLKYNLVEVWKKRKSNHANHQGKKMLRSSNNTSLS